MNFNRQLKIIDPEVTQPKIAIIGAGATGSAVAYSLAQMGLTNIVVYDFDKVEEHNIANQIFLPRHVGMNKVDALLEMIIEKTGSSIIVKNEEVKGQTIDAEYVFLLTDTMSSRKEIYQKCLKYSPSIKYVFETRMGLNEGRVYCFAPTDFNQSDRWEASLYDDDVADVSQCGTKNVVLNCAQFISTVVISKLIHLLHIRFNDNRMDLTNKVWHEMHFSLYPESFLYIDWEDGDNKQHFLNIV